MKEAVAIPYHFTKITVDYTRYGDFTLFILLLFFQYWLSRKYPNPVNNEQVRSFVLDEKNNKLLGKMYKIQCEEGLNFQTQQYPEFVVN